MSRKAFPFILTNAIALALFCGESTAQQSGGEAGRDEYSGKAITSQKMAFDMVKTRNRNVPRPGEAAPDAQLYSLTKKENVTISSLYRDKPVVLLITSWTCDVFRESFGGLVSLAAEYEEDVNFAMIYIREAHPATTEMRDYSRVPDPRSDEERKRAAQQCARQMRIPFEILVDPVSDPVATRWGAWPVRLFVIDTNGIVSYSGRQGPWGYRPYEGFVHGPEEVAKEDPDFSSGSLEEWLCRRFP